MKYKVIICKFLGRGTLGICSVVVLRIFLCGVAVKKIPAGGIAVILSLTVCDVCISKSMVYGEMKLCAVFLLSSSLIFQWKSLSRNEPKASIK